MLRKQRAQSLMGFKELNAIQRELEFVAEKATSVGVNAIGQEAGV